MVVLFVSFLFDGFVRFDVGGFVGFDVGGFLGFDAFLMSTFFVALFFIFRNRYRSMAGSTATA
jgi:hypothetical protein